MWQTTYWHQLPSHEGVIEWYSGSSLRPYLQQLGEAYAAAFLEDVRAAVDSTFAAEPSGEVILQFPCLFWVATKGA